MNRLIAFEGGDGVGKATQSKLLVENIKAAGKDAVLYSFPRYETDVGRAIRRHLVGETKLVELKREYPQAPEDDLMFQCLMLADKYDVEPEIEDHLRRGVFVVSDRWKSSSLAYGGADGLPPEWLGRIHERLTTPALTILLKVPEDVALARRPALRDRYEKDRVKQAAVAARYKELAKDSRWVTVDGSGTVEEVSETIWGHVARKFCL